MKEKNLIKKKQNRILIWLATSLMRAISKLKPKTQLNLGKKLGQLLQKSLRSHRKYVAINLNLCFPKKTADFRSKLANDYFKNFGMGLLECCMTGFTPTNKLPPYKILGFKHVEPYIKEGRPIIFISAHFSTMIMMGRLMSELFQFHAVFRLQRDGLFNKLLIQYANDYGVTLIPPKLAQIIRCINDQKKLLYFIDQDHGYTHSTFAPFFGIEVATIKALPYITENTNAIVIPVFCYRKFVPDIHYELTFLPPLSHYPSGHEEKDATYINQILEAAIKKQPELYFWYYKRFRTRPRGEESFYH